ncbi:LOW QUALITY PROTEIN: hypothetical protein U9M48_041490 [Paspalum notatum var. saurae]|uniref:Uncharacterized protein n=1 Tax=Paspalum notatum var. saurae TaxID=547442 RepID=A0AAQ3XDD6_PASNO
MDVGEEVVVGGDAVAHLKHVPLDASAVAHEVEDGAAVVSTRSFAASIVASRISNVAVAAGGGGDDRQELLEFGDAVPEPVALELAGAHTEHLAGEAEQQVDDAHDLQKRCHVRHHVLPQGGHLCPPAVAFVCFDDSDLPPSCCPPVR